MWSNGQGQRQSQAAPSTWPSTILQWQPKVRPRELELFIFIFFFPRRKKAEGLLLSFMRGKGLALKLCTRKPMTFPAFPASWFWALLPPKSGTRRHVSKACFFLRHETCLNFVFHLRMISQALQVFLLPSCTVWSRLLGQDPSFNPAVVVPRDFSLPGRLWHAGEKLCLAEVLSSFLASTAYCTQRHREGEISLCLCSDSAFLQTMLLLVYVSLLKDSLHSI